MSMILDPTYSTFVTQAHKYTILLARAAEANDSQLNKTYFVFSVTPKNYSPTKQRHDGDYSLHFHTILTKNYFSYPFEKELVRLKTFIGSRDDLSAECTISGFDLKGRAVILGR